MIPIQSSIRDKVGTMKNSKYAITARKFNASDRHFTF